MSTTTYIIIGLIILSYFQYSSPEKTNKMLDSVWGPVKGFIGQNNPLGAGTDKEDSNSGGVTCPDTNEPVCGNGKTYKNSCEAALDGVFEMTPGAC